jgi:ribosomal protein S18 acetylase RimI-like enzyme
VLRLAVQERRVLCATLHVDVSNSAALGLYRKAGFVEVRLLLVKPSAQEALPVPQLNMI